MDQVLSVVVPIYNVGLYLEECLRSIIKQTYTCIEIILVDDGSTDGSNELCDRYADKDKRIRVIHKKNGGLISARKVGVQAATGEYVTYVDGDDWIEPDLYERIISVIEKKACDVLCCAHKRDAGGHCEVIANLAKNGEYRDENSRKQLAAGLLCDETAVRGTINCCVWSKVFRRDLLCKNILEMREDYAYGEDAVCTLACIVDSQYTIVNNDICGYHYRLNGDSITNTYDENFLGHSLALYSELDRIIESRQYYELTDHVNKYKLYIMLTGVAKIVSGQNKFSFIKQYGYFRRIRQSETIKELMLHYEAEQIPVGRKWKKMYSLLKKGKLCYMVLAGMIPHRFYYYKFPWLSGTDRKERKPD